MTATGVAFIVGGIATLIGFRSVLFGTRRRKATEADPAGAEAEVRPAATTEVVLSWPPINEPSDRSWSSRNVNSGPGILSHPRTVFPGRPGERPTVLEKRSVRSCYVSRHAAPPPH